MSGDDGKVVNEWSVRKYLSDSLSRLKAMTVPNK